MLLLLLTVIVVVGLVIASVTSIARRRTRRGLRLRGTLVAVIVLYTAALLAVGLASTPRTLADGQWKCFDEWCATLESNTHTSADLSLVLGISNNGRHAERPDAPHVFVLTGGGWKSVTVPGLSQRLPGHTEENLNVTVPSVPAAKQLLVTEGGFPSVLSIGDENSPFHAKATWVLSVRP